MRKIATDIARFMYGRYGMYGIDTLAKVQMWTYFVILIIYSVLMIVFKLTMPLNFLASIILNISYSVISILLIFWMFFRMFSKNIAKRRRENEKFSGFFKLWKNKFRDRKTHVYRKCPKCKAVLRLPKAKGKHTVVCPRCKDRFSVRG